MQTFVYLALVVVICIAAAADSCEYERECQARGGHIVTKWTYKSSVKFCISNDGRVLEYE